MSFGIPISGQSPEQVYIHLPTGPKFRQLKQPDVANNYSGRDWVSFLSYSLFIVAAAVAGVIGSILLSNKEKHAPAPLRGAKITPPANLPSAMATQAFVSANKASPLISVTAVPKAAQTLEKEERLNGVPIKKVGGFANKHNTCYMAGVLQAMFSTPGFYETYLAASASQMKRKAGDAAAFAELSEQEGETEDQYKKRLISSDPKKAVRESLCDLYECSRNGNSGIVNLDHIRQLHIANGWKPSIPAQWDPIRGLKSQQDAQEYFQFIMESLNVPAFHYSKIRYKDGPGTQEEVSVDSGTMLRVGLSESTAESDLSDLLVHEKSSVNGGEKALYALRMDPKSLPKVLPVLVDRYMKAGGKNKSPVKPAEVIELPICPDGKTIGRYRLSSCIVHQGNTASSGHYYTYAKGKVDGKDQWIELNDPKVEVCQPQSLAEADIKVNGCLFFYTREM